jgi:hypothetical protein
VFAEIIDAAAECEQSNRTHPMPRQQRQLGYAAAQNSGICSKVPCRGSPSGNREYSAFCSCGQLSCLPLCLLRVTEVRSDNASRQAGRRPLPAQYSCAAAASDGRGPRFHRRCACGAHRMRGAKSRALSYAPGAHRRAASRLLALVDRRRANRKQPRRLRE